MIRTEDRGDVRVVTLDRPERRNALTLDGLADLERAVEGAALTGAGGALLTALRISHDRTGPGDAPCR